MESLISHIEFNVVDYKKSIRFYDIIFPFMGLKRINCTEQYTAYTDGMSKIIITPTEEKYAKYGFHRKKPGLNHLAFYAPSKKHVDIFHQETMVKNNIPPLYKDGPFGDKDYYAVFFEDPDRLKIEYVAAPKYCEKEYWPNNIPSDFDPYS